MTWTRSLIHVALAASLGVNVWLGGWVLTLDRTVHSLTARRTLEVGTRVPELDLTATSGERVHIRYNDNQLPTLLYVLSPNCQWCARNAPSVTILAQLLVNKARVVGLSIGPGPNADRILQPAQHGFPVYLGLSDSTAKSLRVRSTPTTVLVSPDGRVLAVWEGAYVGETKTGLEKYFDVSLPPVADEVVGPIVDLK